MTKKKNKYKCESCKVTSIKKKDCCGKPMTKIKEKKEYPQTKEQKLARFQVLARSQNKKAGEAVISFGSDMVYTTKTTTGVPEIDDLLGGGIPNGRIITVWGDKGCGKTTLALEYVARCQKAGKVVYYIALEKLDKARAEELGVNLNELMIGQFPKAEQCLDSILEYAREKTVDVIILDSIHSLSPEGEQVDKKGKKKTLSDDTMALLARKLSIFFRQANHPLATAGITLFLIGQTRTKLGFIALEALTGGNALKHYSKLILHMRHGQGKNAPKIHVEDENGDGKTLQIGFECVVKIDRTQIQGTKPELTEVRFPFYFSGGFTKKEGCLNKIEGEGIPISKVFDKVRAENEKEKIRRSQEAEANATEDAIVDEQIKKPNKETVAEKSKKRGRGRPRKKEKTS